MQIIRILKKFLILIILIFTYVNFADFINLNYYSIGVVKSINQGTDNENYKNFDSKLVSHYEWLNLVGKGQKNKEIPEKTNYYNFIHHSQLYANMIRVLIPNELDLASEANQYYPNTKNYLYWILESAGSDVELSKNTINEILEVDPLDSVAWRRLGSILRENGEREEGLQSFLNACEIDDRESNGCYYVGASYKDFGDLEKAIYYFRLSYWSPSWEIADQLEAELSSQNP